MRKNTHPVLIETKIQSKDGALYKKKWLFFRSSLPLEIDSQKQPLWKKGYKNANAIFNTYKEILLTN